MESKDTFKPKHFLIKFKNIFLNFKLSHLNVKNNKLVSCLYLLYDTTFKYIVSKQFFFCFRIYTKEKIQPACLNFDKHQLLHAMLKKLLASD
jgi:hypothetical protein